MVLCKINRCFEVKKSNIFEQYLSQNTYRGILNARAQQLAGHTGAILAKNAQTNYALSFKAYVACTQKA